MDSNAATTNINATDTTTTTTNTPAPHSSRHRRRRQRPTSHGINTTTTTTMTTMMTLLVVWGVLLLLSVSTTTFVGAQFNEPPGQRREQTFRIREFETSNINQHYPGLLRYYCTFRGKWSEERHPNDFPTSPSWSAPALVSHSKDWRMWTGTETVTAGVEYMAEEGYPTILYNEFQNAGHESLHMIVGERMYNTTESQHLPPINVTYAHPWLSAMTKITPSPDWFVGFSDFRTISYDTETFYNRFVIQSYVWDSGTDDGQNYLSFDRDLDPQVPCMRFCVPPQLAQGGLGTFDSNIVHTPGATQVHHPTGNTHKCPDKANGRVQVPRAGQFLDYSASYIPFPAEYECVLRVGDGEVYAGNAFDEDQIRPPKFVARPDDDFLDGLSPYDQPAYDNYVKSLEEEIEEPESWNKHLLWLLLLLLCCCCPCVIFLFYMWLSHRKKKNGELMTDENSELYLDMFVDEGVVRDDGSDDEDDEYDDRDATTTSFVDNNIDEYEDATDENGSNNLASGKGTTATMRDSSADDFYGDDNGHGLDSSYNTGVSAGDDYDSWLASQNVSQQVEYEDEDENDGGRSSDSDNDNDSYDEDDHKKPSSKSLKPPSMRSLT